MTTRVVLAVDGGNFKTDLALVRADGSALALVRGPQSSPHHLGVDGCVRVLEELLATAVRVADLPNGRGPVADVAQLLLAGVDFPSEEEEVQTAVNDRRLAKRVSVGNDTYAVLRAGTERGVGIERESLRWHSRHHESGPRFHERCSWSGRARRA